MGVPCMTLRTSTERPETVTMGTNELLGVDPKALKPALDRLFAGQWKRGQVPPLWDGKTGERIVAILENRPLRWWQGPCARDPRMRAELGPSPHHRRLGQSRFRCDGRTRLPALSP